jgi:heptosyltransferase-3
MRRLVEATRLPVLVLGAAGEKDAVLPALPQEPACIPLFGERLSLVSSVIKRAGLFVGNDSGPAHLAEVWERPKIVMYRDDPDNFAKWAPLDRENSLVLFASQAGRNWNDVEAFAAARLGRSLP